jgi:hypothetical protein
MLERSFEPDRLLSDEEGTSDLGLTRAAIDELRDQVDAAGGTSADFSEAARRLLGEATDPRRIGREILEDVDESQR